MEDRKKLSSDKPTGSITIDGVEIDYLVDGKGIPCLVIGSPWKFYSPLFSNKLKEYFQLIFINYKIYVPYVKFELDSITIDSIVEDVEKTRVALDLDKVAIIGHSAAGLIALEYARTYAENCTHVILIGLPPNYNPHVQKMISDNWEENASEGRKKRLNDNLEKYPTSWDNLTSPEDIIKGFRPRFMPMDWYDMDNDMLWILDGVEYNPETFSHFYYKLCFEYDFSQYFHEVTTPIFMVLGRYDFASPYTLWTDALLSKFRNLTYYLFEKSGHFAMYEEQEKFDEILIEWIQTEKKK